MNITINDLPKSTNLPSPDNIILPVYESRERPYPVCKISIPDLVSAIVAEAEKYGNVNLFVDLGNGILSFKRKK